MPDNEAMSSLVYALVLMIMPVVGALLYAGVQWVLLLRRRRRSHQESLRRCDASTFDSDSNDDDVSAVVQYAAHVCALLLLSGSIVLVAMETFEAFMVFEEGTDEVVVKGIVVIVGVALGILVVAVIRSPLFVQCVDVALGSIVRHHRPPFSPKSPSTPAAQQRRLSSSVVLSIVMFVHAGLEGVVLGLIYHRPVFFATFWSVALHNVPEGLVMAVPVFGDLHKASQERHLSRRKVAESGEEDNGTLSLPRPHAPASLLVAACHRWWQGVWESSLAALWSHAGQAVAFLWVVLSKQPLVDTTTARTTATAEPAMSLMEAFVTFASIGSMVGTIAMEIVPDVLDVPDVCVQALGLNKTAPSRKSTTKVY